MKAKLHLLIAIFFVAMVTNVNAQLPIFEPGMTITTYGTVNIPSDGESIDKIIDGLVNTKFLNFDGEALDSGFDVDLGGATAVANRIDITTGGDEPKRDISSVVISGSDDGTTWTEIATVVFPCDQPREFTSAVEFTNTTAYGHYRIYFASLCDVTTDMTQVAEIQLYDTTQDPPLVPQEEFEIFEPGMTIATYGTVNIPGDGEAIEKIIDGLSNTKFLNFDGELLDSGFDVDLGGFSAMANRIDITTGEDAPNRDISSVVISGSIDGTSWTKIATVDFPCDQPRNSTSSVDFTNTTAYAHYRIYFASLCDVNTDMTQVAEIQLFDTTQEIVLVPQDKYEIFEPGMTIATYGTVSIPGAGESIDKIIDGLKTTKFLNLDGELLDSGFDVYLDGVTAVANKIDITTGGDEPRRDISSVVISGSLDGTTWTEIATVDFPCDQPRAFTSSVEFTNTTAYAHYRIFFASLCDATIDMIQVAEIQMYDMSFQPAPIKAVFNTKMSVYPYGATVNWGGDDTYHEGPYSAIDGNAETKYFNFDGGNGTGFTVDLVDITAVAVELRITTANDSPERDPASYEVYGSNDNVTYDMLGSGDIADNDTRFDETAYVLTNTTSYQYYRINFPTLRGGAEQVLFQVAEAQLIYEGELTPITANKVFYEGMPATVADGNNSPGPEGFEKSLDELYYTKWLNFDGNLGSGFIANLEGNAVAATELRLTTANDGAGRDPSSIVLSGSNDNVSFREIATVNVPCDGRRHLVRSFDIANSKVYSYYKVDFPTLCDAGQNLFQISDIVMFHDGTVVSNPVFNVTFTVADAEAVAIEGAQVEFNGTTVTTDSDGMATFSDVAAVTGGAYTVSKTDYTSADGTVTVIDGDEMVDAEINSTVGVNSDIASSFSVYPNPTDGMLNLEFGQELNDGRLSIYNSIGKEILSQELNEISLSLDLTSYSSGVYYIKVTSEKENFTEMFILN